ncbi:MAG: hypothetical protein RDU89_04305 [bacterium]|nr:hypothetical protein [bacterium]
MLGAFVRVILWLVAGLVVLMGAVMLVFLVPHSLYWRSREETLAGADPTRRALVVYQPGLGPRTREAALSLAQGLSDAGYTVILNRPGRHLPTDLSAYRLVAFGSPVYAGRTSPALRRYLRSVTGYGQAAIILFTSGGDPDNDNTGQLAALVPPERILHRVKFLATQDNRAAARSLGRDLGSRD